MKLLIVILLDCAFYFNNVHVTGEEDLDSSLMQLDDNSAIIFFQPGAQQAPTAPPNVKDNFTIPTLTPPTAVPLKEALDKLSNETNKIPSEPALKVNTTESNVTTAAKESAPDSPPSIETNLDLPTPTPLGPETPKKDDAPPPSPAKDAETPPAPAKQPETPPSEETTKGTTAAASLLGGLAKYL